MGRFCNGLMTVFRIIQLILSLAALGCGAFIMYTMFDMASAANNIEVSLLKLSNITEVHSIEQDLSGFNLSDSDVLTFLGTLDALLTPLLHLLEGTPTRAIILTVVSFWSICTIIYLLIAQRATKKAIRTSTPSPSMNKRSVRISLELLTLLLWIIGIVCAALLAAEYGAIIFTGGAELKFAWSAIKPILEKAVETLVGDGTALRELGIVNDLFNIGAMAILAVVASGICGGVSFVSLCASCCISGKAKKRGHGQLESGAAAESLVPSEGDKPGVAMSQRSSPISSAAWTPMSKASSGYSPAPQYESGVGGWYR